MGAAEPGGMVRWLARVALGASFLAPLLLSGAGCEIMEHAKNAPPEQDGEPPPAPTGCAEAPSFVSLSPLEGKSPTSASFALDRCRGEVGLAWTEPGTVRDALWFVRLAPGGAFAHPPVQLASGSASRPRVVETGDGFVVAWLDARHDASPATCTSCTTEVYAAAIDRSGGAGAPQRLSNKVGPARDLRLSRNEGELVVAWCDARAGQNAVWARRLDAAARPRDAELRVSAPGGSATAPSISFSGGTPLVAYSLEGTGTPKVLVRPLDGTTTQRPIRDGSRPELVAHDGVVTVLSQGGISGAFLDFVTPSWTVSRSTPAPASTSYDGSWSLAWDGQTYWVLSGMRGTALQAVRYGAQGGVVGRADLGFLGDASDVEMALAGKNVIGKWRTGTGAVQLAVAPMDQP